MRTEPPPAPSGIPSCSHWNLSEECPPLRLLIDEVDQAGGPDPGPVLWWVVPALHDTVELWIRRLTEHPFVELVGFDAPQDWSVLGVRAHGRARSLERAEGPTAAVAVTIGVARDGTGWSRLRWLDGNEAEVGHGPAEGLVADACRRALGLPTEPPTRGTVGAWAQLWLDRLVQSAGDPTTRPRSFAAAVALHPAGEAEDPAGRWLLADPRDLVDAALEHAGHWSWTRLRAAPAELGPAAGALPEPALAWMDDGLFSRWVTTGLPEPDALVEAVIDLLPARVAAPVVAVARQLLAAG